ncbi:unnamed protein product [Adineta ricciae]|uniref:Uncharacterized protein n=1 Tax=Adineta ricciae TaxID=249248 RepID=A0A813VZ17_ADIRI|nr:unnamed protein product [Adineta ricciae]CAF1085452.1 unnamed protein product [Adineta ricciae]
MNENQISYSIPSSDYWEPWLIGLLATGQLLMTLGVLAMEIGNAIVDLFRANVYSGFWSCPFMLAAVLATYAYVCTKRTRTKSFIALILQSISILVVLLVLAFLIAIIASNFSLCLGIQCSQEASTYFSTTTYNFLKRAFILCEFLCAIIYIVFAFIYVFLFIQRYQKSTRVNPTAYVPSARTTILRRRLPASSRKARWKIGSNRLDVNERVYVLSSTLSTYSGAQQVCPICKHISLYIPQGNIVQCPKCAYQSPFVEHAQQ